MKGDAMNYDNAHLSDEDLLLAADGEPSPKHVKRVQAHLAECPRCRARMSEMERGIAGFVSLHRGNLDPLLPPAARQRSMLKAQLETLKHPSPASNGWLRLACGLAAMVLVVVGAMIQSRGHVAAAKPAPSLTPGATRLVTRDDVCRADQREAVRILPAVQRQVFAQYGLANADPRAYEIDYLITPELGGADDIRNLWPEPYSTTLWNAHVKDELEDRLHELVCDGTLDLATAQHDIATDWIAAYKKYFHADRPLANRPD
jgi:hypothetical protein